MGEGEATSGEAGSFEANGWKIMSALVLTGIIAGASLLVNIDKRLALVEQQLVLATADRFTKPMQDAYAAGVAAERSAISVRVQLLEDFARESRLEIAALKKAKP